MLAFIGMGSNLENPLQQIRMATTRLTQLPHTTFCQASSCYQSPPLGPSHQPDYINCVVAVETQLSPVQLLDCLQAIELEQGRVRLERWGPRTIDLDILLYGDQVIATTRLTVPHAGLPNRAFFLYPLMEIAPELILPNGESVAELKINCVPNGIRRCSQDE